MSLSSLSIPKAALARRLVGRDRPFLLGELLVVLILVKVYDFVRSLAEARETDALRHGRDILALESRLHIDIERTLNGWLNASSAITDLAAGWYQFMHLTVTLSVLAACYYRRPDIYRRARNALVLVNLIGLAVFWLYPVAPPRLLPGMGFIDSTALPGIEHGPAQISPDMFAALPSLHVAWAAWTVIVLRHLLREYPTAQTLAPLYAGVTSLVVITTANHYVLDVVAGIAVSLAAAGATGLIGSAVPARSLKTSRVPWTGTEAIAEPE